MPSHQIRVQQNNCDHFVVKIKSDLGLFQKCMKCGKEVHIPIDKLADAK